ncbi:hypothetical protein [Rhodococcus sp. 1168]|uniref:hypothetical protein n=1 Tax=Rhodococcus sp. 1168 TaxID=2018041 RepID=UPI000A0B2A5D|nr:hypothetical protein [Rhodococcus sp. 1168]ORI13449.1 hypothetical protein BJI47_22665 [Rhodococcus sp. 1168]
MRSFGDLDPSYVYADDETPIMCVGSNTPGPWRPGSTFSDELARMGFVNVGTAPMTVRTWNIDFSESRNIEVFHPAFDGAADTDSATDLPPRNAYTLNGLRSARANMAALRTFPVTIPDGAPYDWASGSISDASGTFAVGGFRVTGDVPEPDTRTPQQRALPQPSTTPPMWAHDPTRSRRPKRKKNQPTRQGTR